MVDRSCMLRNLPGATGSMIADAFNEGAGVAGEGFTTMEAANAEDTTIANAIASVTILFIINWLKVKDINGIYHDVKYMQKSHTGLTQLTYFCACRHARTK
jgi:hypothetical protein